MFDEYDGYTGNIITSVDEIAFNRRGLCVSGSAHDKMVAAVGRCQLPYPRVSQAKFRDETSLR